MKEQVDYFLGSIFEAKSAYNAWKMIVYSRWESYVGKDLAEKYVKIQKYHRSLFTLLERSLFFHWVLLIFHCFDRNDNSFSLRKISPKEIDEFLNETSNKKTFEKLKNVRDKLLAHRDGKIESSDIGNVESLDLFFGNVESLYNEIRKNFDRSGVLFENTNEVKFDIENLFMNIERGENVRKNEIDIDWLWKKNPKRISNIL